MKPLVLALAVVGVCVASLAQKARADEPLNKAVDGDVYELRVWMGYPLLHPDDLTLGDRKPEIDTQIKVGKFFSASNQLLDTRITRNGVTEEPSKVLYVASGVLHPSDKGQFFLECAFSWWGRSGSLVSGPSTWHFELGKSEERMLSVGLVQGYTAILTKVVKPAEQMDKQGVAPSQIPQRTQ